MVTQPCTDRAVNMWRCWSDRAPTDGEGGARPALAHNTTTPSPHCAARMFRGQSADTPRGEKRAGRASQGLYEVAKALESSCRRPLAVLVRSSLGQSRWEECASRWATIQSFQVRRAACGACSMSGRPILDGAKSERGAGHGTKPRSPQTFTHRAAVLSWWWCGRASADGVGRSPPRVGHIATPSLHSKARVLCERSVVAPRREKRTGRSP